MLNRTHGFRVIVLTTIPDVTLRYNLIVVMLCKIITSDVENIILIFFIFFIYYLSLNNTSCRIYSLLNVALFEGLYDLV